MMFRQFAALLLATMPGLSGTARLAAQDATGKEIMRLEDAWGAASIKRDGATVGRMLADDFSFTGADGKVLGKADLVQEINEDTTQYQAAAGSEYRVRVYGSTAVVTGLWTETVKTQSGNEQYRYRWTDTWTKSTSGQWLCVAGQSTLLPK